MTKCLKTCLLAVTFIFSISSLIAQSLDYVQGELLVQLTDNQRPEDMVNEYARIYGSEAFLQIDKKLKAPMAVWKFLFDHNSIDNDLIIRRLDRLTTVAVVQNNHFITPRATFPDDPLFNSQWQWFNDGSQGALDADVDAELAWDITTGGITPDGDDIVVAVLDDGTELSHPDLIDNHWVNVDEIPDNGIDDDGNGYIDDYNGWNIFTNNDDVSGGDHGLAVSGMIGAKGNNGVGITGINWDVKIMTVKNNFATQEDRVLEAYAYPYIMRKRYNESNGAEGAFVVASNASWGIDGGDPANSPLWCQFYDSLGVQGILNCGATSNASINVDIEGDLPTTCPSDYMVAVTRSSINDEQSGGFGPVHIDLAAPGQNIFSASTNGGYDNTTGTSFSCPLVAGIVALMYSAPCPNLTALAKSNPGLAALEARRLLLENVDVINGYDVLVETGGRANAFNAVAEIIENCGPCPGPRALESSNFTLNSAELSWTNGTNATSSKIRYREVGAVNWINIPSATTPYNLTGLSSCSDYEFQVQNECLDSMATSDYTASVNFRTDGCCDAPSAINIDNISITSFEISWDPVTLADSYTVIYRPSDAIDWDTLVVSDNNISVDELEPCIEYDLSIKTNCTSINSSFSNIISITTKGCGACIENQYCEIVGNTNLEHIESVTLNGNENISGSNGGYALFDANPPSLLFGSENQLKIFIGYVSFSYAEVTTVFIDFNADGEFSLDENIGNISQADSAVFDFIVPFTATQGLTRMRVIMGYQANTDIACPISLDGEVEDYCVFLDDPMLECEFNGAIDSIGSTDASISLSWPEQTAAVQYQLRWKESTENTWNAVVIEETTYELTDLKFCTDYDFQAVTICSGGLSPFSEEFTYSTSCLSNTSNIAFDAFTLSPNPFSDVLNLSFDSPIDGALEITVMNNLGELVASNSNYRITQGNNSIVLNDFDNLNNGIYFLSLSVEDLHKVVKVIKL